MQEHTHYYGNQGKVPNTSDGTADFRFAGGNTFIFGESLRTGVVAFARTNTTTHGKQKGVKFIIKVL